MTRLFFGWGIVALLVLVNFSEIQAQTEIYRNQMNGTDFRFISPSDLTGANTDTRNVVRTGFDYAAGNVGENYTGGPFPASIPEAPHTQVGDAPRTGLYMAVNTVAPGAVNELAALPLDPNNASQLLAINGDYDVQVDIWINFDATAGTAGPGTTEFAGMFIGHDGVTAVRNGAGFIATGEGGSGRDYRLYKNTGEQFIQSGQYNSAIRAAWEADVDFDGDVTNAVNNFNDFWETKLLPNDVGVALESDDGQGVDQIGVLFPDDDAIPENGGGGGELGFRWVTLTYEVRPNAIGEGTNTDPNRRGVTTIYMEAEWETGNPLDPNDRTIVNTGKFLIGRIDNTNVGAAVNMTGTPALIYADHLFSSLNTSGYQFGIFDNLIVTQIDPPGSDGDYNDDGFVDARDYVIWRDNPDGFGGDPDGYNAWRANFGATPGSGSSTAIPEPASCMLLLVGFALLNVARRFHTSF